jgi:electron-transferring-flavoprotein dehydrogenase
VKPIDVLIVGAGPAGLAAAIRLKGRLDADGREGSVVVIDKAPNGGYHNLSGAAFESSCLDELLPGWQDERSILTDHVIPVKHDEMYFLVGGSAIRIPSLVVPRRMHHKGDVTISLSNLVAYLTHQAERKGVEIYHGYSAKSLILEGGAVKGVTLADVGLDKSGEKKPNYRAGEEIRAAVTILADGTRGVLSTQFGEVFGTGRNPQVYSLGIKAVVQFPGENPFGNNRVVHTLGHPLPSSVFGGGFMYSTGEKTVAVGLIMGLDWKYGDLNPHREFERFRAHPFIEKQLKGGVTIATGAKTIPEGGIFSMGPLVAPGALLAGDSAGFVNMEKIKGIHYAVRTGMAAADIIAEAFAAGDFGAEALSPYRDRLVKLGIIGEFEHARNYRQSFRWGLYAGTPLSMIGSRLPIKLKAHPDHAATRARKRLRRKDPGRMDQATFVSLTGSLHREDEPSHVTILDPSRCLECADRFAASCTSFCPGQVYRWTESQVTLSPSNCLHCMTCTVKCPYSNIRWVPPEGGEGPRFKQM